MLHILLTLDLHIFPTLERHILLTLKLCLHRSPTLELYLKLHIFPTLECHIFPTLERHILSRLSYPRTYPPLDRRTPLHISITRDRRMGNGKKISVSNPPPPKFSPQAPPLTPTLP
jgi:hypothetical protein